MRSYLSDADINDWRLTNNQWQHWPFTLLQLLYFKNNTSNKGLTLLIDNKNRNCTWYLVQSICHRTPVILISAFKSSLMGIWCHDTSNWGSALTTDQFRMATRLISNFCLLLALAIEIFYLRFISSTNDWDLSLAIHIFGTNGSQCLTVFNVWFVHSI